MSDSSAKSASWVSVTAVFIGFALFLLLVKYTYLSHPSPAPHTIAPEELPADLAWKANSQTRRDYLAELHKKEGSQAAKYGWIDQTKGTVQLPIDRAMQLTVQEINTRQARDLPTRTNQR